VSAEAVLLNASDPAQNSLGDLVYAGGVALTSDQTTRLHGLSDLEVSADGSLVAISDEGDLVRGRVVLDARGTLTGVDAVRVSKLTGLDGRPLQDKAESDSEGLAVLRNGDLLVSFERQHRIWLYPASGGPPRVAPSPRATFPENQGMEALALDPSRGPAAYIVGAEESGQTWLCALASACTAGPAVVKDKDAGLVAVRRLPDDDTVWLLRSFTPAGGNVVVLRITNGRGQTIDEQTIRPPITVDNFEGVSAVDRGDGTIRFYLVSDDNFSSTQRTLLLAFDWRRH
jgi:hypothetical protein